MVLSAKVHVRPGGIHGYGWFATDSIQPGEAVWWMGNDEAIGASMEITVAALRAWPQAQRDRFMALAYQIDDGLYRGIDPTRDVAVADKLEYLVNHACDGNCWYASDAQLVAKRVIKSGEELCYDYALTEADDDWLLTQACQCNSPNCRKRVTGRDWRHPELQSAYRGHFLEYINQKIAALSQ